ncbi:hypothetical protein PPACK8108_LOCUS12001 [Phakopsora pachyrhizi]|uniref:Uncharacterized protein n=1 Tax=Phakopsora pachyrhizi TaxID=170000 RepID=A0AAV0B129_PHAPC|nr:hypothetical protein PPACK8108_LOCUS12001 [Phakopsora pachyrhizi]
MARGMKTHGGSTESCLNHGRDDCEGRLQRYRRTCSSRPLVSSEARTQQVMPLNWMAGSRVTLGNGNCNSSDDHFKSKSGLDTVGEMNWDECLLLLVEGREDCQREMEKELSVIPEPLVEISGEDEEVDESEVEGVEKDEEAEEDDREDDDNDCANLLVRLEW